MTKPETLWVEIESRISEYRIRTFRGKVLSSDVASLTSGQGSEFLRLTDCYWYIYVDDEEETGKAQGTFDRLGYGVYTNFTGEMFLRSSSILNVSILKAGFEGEFAGNVQAH